MTRCLVAAALVLAVLTSCASGPTSASAPAPTPSPEYIPPPPPPPPAPQVGMLTSGPEYERARQMLRTLVNQVPPGYTTPATEMVEGVIDGRPVQIMVQLVQVFRTRDGGVSYHASTDVYRGEQGGNLSVNAVAGPGASPVSDDPCAIPGQPHQGVDEGCHVVTASNGLKVRLSSSARGGSRIYFAEVAYQDVTISMGQTLLGGVAAKAPLPGPFLSERDLAELVALPAFKP